MSWQSGKVVSCQASQSCPLSNPSLLTTSSRMNLCISSDHLRRKLFQCIQGWLVSSFSAHSIIAPLLRQYGPHRSNSFSYLHSHQQRKRALYTSSEGFCLHSDGRMLSHPCIPIQTGIPIPIILLEKFYHRNSSESVLN